MRFDANTLRVILGNDAAVKAIADNNTNPWPDGAAFAKVGWLQQPDEHGIVQAGAFTKAGFMIKDKSKFAATAGWGWAEWVGSELKPYGDGSGFAAECVNCHTPLRKSDYVFTMPIQFFNGPRSISKTANESNVRARLSGDTLVNPLKWSVITCGTNPQEATMSTLFGNDIAVHYARTHSDGRLSQSYQDYEGSPFKAVTAPASRKDGRIAYILSQRAAVMP